MGFRDWLNDKKIEEQALIESAGNLKGLPKTFIKRIVGGYNTGLGGANSELKLFKANAKQKDLTAATKLVGGFVKKSDIGTRNYSKAELEAKANKDALLLK